MSFFPESKDFEIKDGAFHNVQGNSTFDTKNETTDNSRVVRNINRSEGQKVDRSKHRTNFNNTGQGPQNVNSGSGTLNNDSRSYTGPAAEQVPTYPQQPLPQQVPYGQHAPYQYPTQTPYQATPYYGQPDPRYAPPPPPAGYPGYYPHHHPHPVHPQYEYGSGYPYPPPPVGSPYAGYPGHHANGPPPPPPPEYPYGHRDPSMQPPPPPGQPVPGQYQRGDGYSGQRDQEDYVYGRQEQQQTPEQEQRALAKKAANPFRQNSPPEQYGSRAGSAGNPWGGSAAGTPPSASSSS